MASPSTFPPYCYCVASYSVLSGSLSLHTQLTFSNFFHYTSGRTGAMCVYGREVLVTSIHIFVCPLRRPILSPHSHLTSTHYTSGRTGASAATYKGVSLDSSDTAHSYSLVMLFPCHNSHHYDLPMVFGFIQFVPPASFVPSGICGRRRNRLNCDSTDHRYRYKLAGLRADLINTYAF